MNTIERSAPISSCGTWARKLISLLADSASPVGKWSAHPIPLSTSVHICPLPNGSLPSTCSPLWESCSPHWENKPRLKNCYTKWHRQLVPGNQQSGGQFQKSMTSFHPISDPRSPIVPYIYMYRASRKQTGQHQHLEHLDKMQSWSQLPFLWILKLEFVRLSCPRLVFKTEPFWNFGVTPFWNHSPEALQDKFQDRMDWSNMCECGTRTVST